MFSSISYIFRYRGRDLLLYAVEILSENFLNYLLFCILSYPARTYAIRTKNGFTEVFPKNYNKNLKMPQKSPQQVAKGRIDSEPGENGVDLHL